MGRIYENELSENNILDDKDFLLEENNFIIKSENPCRICLEHNDSDKKYCNCKGTLASVHEECLLEWFLYKNKLNGENIYCEICKQKIIANCIKKKGFYILHTIEISLIVIFFIIIMIMVLIYHMYSILIIISSLPLFSCFIVIIGRITEYLITRFKLEIYKLVPINSI